MPTRTVTAASTSRRGPHAFARPRSRETLSGAPDTGSPPSGRPGRWQKKDHPFPHASVKDHRSQAWGGARDEGVPEGWPLLGEHVVGDDGLRVGDPEILCPLVRHGQQTPYATCHRVLGHRRGGARAPFPPGRPPPHPPPPPAAPHARPGA